MNFRRPTAGYAKVATNPDAGHNFASSGDISRKKMLGFCSVIVVLIVLAVAIHSSMAASDGDETTAQVDMHSHSTESDGDLKAEELLEEAKRRNLKALWITDHDMIRDLSRVRELQKAASSYGISLGFGVEITVGWLNKEHHLLGYFPDKAWEGQKMAPPMKSLQHACAQVKSSREDRNSNLVKWVNSALQSWKVYFKSTEAAASYKAISVSAVTAWAQEHAALTDTTSLGRPHFSKYLIKVANCRPDLVFGPRSGTGKGVVTADGVVLWDEEAEGKEGEEVEGLLHSATLARRGITFKPLPISEAITLINLAGGVAVVAHIPTLGPNWLKQFGPDLKTLKQAGLWGIEAFSSEIDEKNNKQILQLAAEVGLETTGGSDNHGTLKGYAGLGDVFRQPKSIGWYSGLALWRKMGLPLSFRISSASLFQTQLADTGTSEKMGETKELEHPLAVRLRNKVVGPVQTPETIATESI